MDVFVVLIPKDKARKSNMQIRIMEFKKSFCWCSNLSNDDIIEARTGARQLPIFVLKASENSICRVVCLEIWKFVSLFYQFPVPTASIAANPLQNTAAKRTAHERKI